MNLTYRPLFDQITITIICAVIHRSKLESYWITNAVFLKKKVNDFDIYTKKREDSFIIMITKGIFKQPAFYIFHGIYYKRYFIK